MAVYRCDKCVCWRPAYDRTRVVTYLEGDVVVPNANLELLFPNNVLLGPIGIILPTVGSASIATATKRNENSLGDLARLDDPLELFDNERADPH